MKRLLGGLSLVIGLVVSAGVLSGTAAATVAAPPDPTGLTAGLATAQRIQLQRQVDDLLAKSPTGKQVGPNQVAWRGGKVTVTIPLPGEKTARAAGEAMAPAGTPNCSYYWTCFYEHADFGGRRLTWSDCGGLHDFQNWDFDNMTSSWHNNQSGGATTTVYKFGNPTGYFTIWTAAPGSSAYVGDRLNDIADAFTAC
ncbi:peptidase inhibitor family I36 protein [Kribbella sp. NBC_01245]|uniref:peptidase inhibitor family I36 protein n=1 Tax=Kribbella sp. NBC_01245 TaxID=2903578 RepID=UPI002E2CF675|nr:peptidase inhibitor family I36 protein [Kribbella sp. NBC_01245]